MESSIDDEWQHFLLDQTCSFNRPSTQPAGNVMIPSTNISDGSSTTVNNCSDIDNHNSNSHEHGLVPTCDDLYISTKTKVLFLNRQIDINHVFWNLQVIPYSAAINGIIKKQMKIVSNNEEEFLQYKRNLENIEYYNEHIIKQINNTSARRNKYKDERKITIGLSKKDIMNCRGKIKSAFYNCFAIIIRFKFDDIFREIHVKIFNTGKLEIPGVLNTRLLDIVKQIILDVLSPHINENIYYIETDTNDEDECNVLINSNFNCGYYINRDKLYSILRSSKYGIETSYDPCSYPGVKCKYYFNHELGFDASLQRGQVIHEDRDMRMCELNDNKKYTEVSFMIFRTGSCLIVGNCTERILKFVYAYIKELLKNEYINIHVQNPETETREKKTKIRKKNVSMTKDYYMQVVSR
jgi:hypothetical protein